MGGNTHIHIHTYISSTYIVTNAMEAHLDHQTLQGNDSPCLPHYDPDTEEPERQAGYI